MLFAWLIADTLWRVDIFMQSHRKDSFCNSFSDVSKVKSNFLVRSDF